MKKWIITTKGATILMRNRKIFVVLGADNVGKTTMINTSMRFAKEQLYKAVSYKHFSAPKPGDDPLQMYINCLHDIADEMSDYVYLDRAWPESKFYEETRRNNEISIERCLEVEKEYVNFAERFGYDISINLMYKPWFFIEQFHINELKNNQEFVQHSALVNNEPVGLQERKTEFQMYYEFMGDYAVQREEKAPQHVKNFPFNKLLVRDLNFVLV